MTDVPETRYAMSGPVHIAYQVVSEGPFDLIGIPPAAQNIQAAWESPLIVRMLRGLGSFCRYVQLDKRGTGMSDPCTGVPPLEERMDDVRAVMDAVGSDRAALLGGSEGGPMAALFAATYPERTSALVLYGTTARFTSAPDYPWSVTPEVFEQVVEAWAASWGTPATLTTGLMAPSAMGDEAFTRWWPSYERQSASPGAFAALMRCNALIDVRAILPTVSVPTLVLHRTGDLAVNIENARYLAATIPGATLVELPGIDHFPFCGDTEGWVDAIAEFLTGVRRDHEPDRVLATVLFTDVVDSTKRAVALGDRAWMELLGRHDAAAAHLVESWRGRLVKTTGDGLVATFDGPARAISCAGAIVGAARYLGIAVRTGLHTGEVEMRGDDIGGIAVHIGARVAALAGPGEVLVSRTVADLVAGSNIGFADRGEHKLKGVPGAWRVFCVDSCP